MKPPSAGKMYELRSLHQSKRRFAPISTIAYVIGSPEADAYKIRLRVFGHGYDSGNGYLHEVLRITDRFWLERIGKPANQDGTGNFPHVHEIIREMTQEEFDERVKRLRAKHSRR